jgi:LEA14-like dessication related protein
MKAKNILLVGGSILMGSALLRYLYKNIILAQDWDYSVDSFQLVSVSPSLKFNLYFSIINKSAFEATIKDIDMVVLSSGKLLSRIQQTGPYTVKPDGTTKIFVTIEVMPEKIFENWREILAQIIATKDVALDFVGKMRVQTPFGFVAIPIQFSNTGQNLYKLYKEYYP